MKGTHLGHEKASEALRTFRGESELRWKERDVQGNSECQNASGKQRSLPIHICKFVALDLDVEGVGWRVVTHERERKEFLDNQRQGQGLAP